MSVLAQNIALGIGAGGGLVDVSSSVVGPEGVTFAWGRQDEFRDPAAGTITFTLENQDGRFTPGNAASPLATLLTEGTPVVWQCAGRLVQMQVIAIGFADSEEQWGRVSITAADALNIANRTTLTGLAASAAAASAYLWWPLTDPAGSAQAIEQSGNGGPTLSAEPNSYGDTSLQFGTAATGATNGDTQLTVASGGDTTSSQYGTLITDAVPHAPAYPAGSLGAWGFWWTPISHNDSTIDFIIGPLGSTAYADIQLGLGGKTGVLSVTIYAYPTSGSPQTSSNATPIPLSFAAHYIAFSTTYVGTAMTTVVYLDGVAVSTLTWTAPIATASLSPSRLRLQVGNGDFGVVASAAFSHISHTPTVVHEEAGGVTTEAARFLLLTQTVPQITAGQIDSALSTSPVDVQNTSGSTAFTALADLLRTEQGHLYFTTTGTLLAPSTVLNFRSRVRSATVAQSFDAQAEVSGVPQFVRDITNMYSTVTATGPNTSATVVDRAAIPRVGSAYVSETVVLAHATDLTSWAQDRLLRGENVNLRVASVTIDLATVANAASTLAKLLALVPGDRVEIANLPSSGLGFTAWDGWFLGAAETHNYTTDTFTLYLAPVLPPTGLFDTDRFANGGTLTLASALTATATTASVATADGVTWFDGTALPYTVLIGTEQVTVTGAATPASGTQTLTITRGVGGTTAAAHAVGAVPEIVSTSNTFAF